MVKPILWLAGPREQESDLLRIRVSQVMNWILSNWVERRAARERNLKNAVDVWRKAQDAIAEACESLNEHYADVAIVGRTEQNRNLLTITITRPATSEMQADETSRSRVIAIEFQADKCKIAVTVGQGTTQEFPIEADSDHTFISWQGQELQLDEFSRFALERAFFGEPESALPSRGLRIVRNSG